MYAAGGEVARDLRRATILYQEACDGGDAVGCGGWAG